MAQENETMLAAVHAAAALGANPPADKPMSVSKAEHDAALATARSEGEAAGSKAGIAAERTRIGAILNHDEAKGREALARHYAFATAASPEEAAAAMQAAPKTEAPKPDALAALAATAPNATLGAAPGQPAATGPSWNKSVERINRSRGFK